MITLLISRLSSMILLTLLGIFTIRVGLFNDGDSKAFSKMVIYVLQPCLIARSFQVDLTKERVFGFFSAMVFSFLVMGIWMIISYALRKWAGFNRVEEMTLVYSNVGNLTLPLVQMVLGDEMVFYASAVQIPFNVFLWTHCVIVLSGEKKIDLKKIFMNSNVIAVFFGIFLMITGIRFPEVVDTAVSSLAAMVGPLSMMVIGMVIGHADLKKIFLFGKGYLIAFMQLLLYPLLAMGLLYLTGFLRIFPEMVPVFQALFFPIAAPPAAVVSQLALLYDEEPVEAGSLNVIGTVLCGLTIPIVLTCFQRLFL